MKIGTWDKAQKENKPWPWAGPRWPGGQGNRAVVKSMWSDLRSDSGWTTAQAWLTVPGQPRLRSSDFPGQPEVQCRMDRVPQASGGPARGREKLRDLFQFIQEQARNWAFCPRGAVFFPSNHTSSWSLLSFRASDSVRWTGPWRAWKRPGVQKEAVEVNLICHPHWNTGSPESW